MTRPVLSLLAALALTAFAAAAVSLAAERGGAWQGGAEGPAELVGAFAWEADLPGFGGLSGLELGADGLDLVAIGDRTTILRGRVARDAAGAVTGVEATAPVDLVGDDGHPLRGLAADSEGLAMDAAGTLWVSFEGHPGVRRLGPPGAPSTLLPGDPAWDALPLNRSLEALAVGPDGALFAIPEAAPDGRFHVYRLGAGEEAWKEAFSLPRRDGFRVTGADIGPDGRLTVLERYFSGWAFRSRLRRFDLDGTGEAVLWTSRAAAFDNLEGVAVWRDDAGLYGGGLRATMVSDDNFRFFQRTELVDLRLPD